ncbi:hypothetical protein SALWKB12_0127 [Snodgrassella communis]|uniref:Uncharacterized protein n=1 Tax=Snodgrassella communis TaxID=2946699 RepID=A0A837AGR6_9NEIS|nr:hypothetical protein SALWKB12_0127 [Snodgrassella communis]KDN14501.1 hypothetical protein SALWKB29_1590 [Snodgrassella communis]
MIINCLTEKQANWPKSAKTFYDIYYFVFSCSQKPKLVLAIFI